ncbi:MAG: cytochrome bc1 complex diheme cytochrome c subunit [Actinomycetota bacterium]
MSMRRLLALALLALGPAAVIQLASASARGQEDVERGFDLYAAGCSTCHGLGGEGTTQGPSLVGVGPAAVDFMLSTGRMPLADPGEQPVRNPSAYGPDEIAAIVAYVISLGPGGPSIPEVMPAAGGLPRGRSVYAANCLACHGAGAQGASVGGGAVAPALEDSTPTQLAEAPRIGPGAMPVFDERVIDEQDMNSLVRYVISLRTGQDRGGLNLGRVGTVTEGLIGWLVGMGLLVLVIRMTGTRT